MSNDRLMGKRIGNHGLLDSLLLLMWLAGCHQSSSVTLAPARDDQADIATTGPTTYVRCGTNNRVTMTAERDDGQNHPNKRPDWEYNYPCYGTATYSADVYCDERCNITVTATDAQASVTATSGKNHLVINPGAHQSASGIPAHPDQAMWYRQGYYTIQDTGQPASFSVSVGFSFAPLPFSAGFSVPAGAQPASTKTFTESGNSIIQCANKVPPDGGPQAGNPTCNSPSDCPPTASTCTINTCINGICGTANTDDASGCGTPRYLDPTTGNMMPNPCQKAICTDGNCNTANLCEGQGWCANPGGPPNGNGVIMWCVNGKPVTSTCPNTQTSHQYCMYPSTPQYCAQPVCKEF